MASAHDVLQHGDVAWALAGTEAVVFHPALRAAHVLDPTATLLWQCLDGKSPLAEIFADLADAFSVPPARVEADCLPVIEAWQSTWMVVPPADVIGREAAPAVPRSPSPPRFLLPPPDT